MNPRVTVAVLIAFLAYAMYSWLSMPAGVEGFVTKSPSPSEYLPAALPLAKEAKEEEVPSRVVSPSGPNSPNEQAPEDSYVVPPEEPYDPQEKDYESATHPNRLRYPERLYGPGLEQTNKQTAVDAGIASNSHQATMSAYQVFGPEFAQNGGLFMDNGVIANDTSVETGYSSI
jgi:hypothetical protein